MKFIKTYGNKSNNKEKIKNNSDFIDIENKSLRQLFIDFYLKNKGEAPREDLISLLLEIIEEEGEIKNETN
jgi:hypothetical protein